MIDAAPHTPWDEERDELVRRQLTAGGKPGVMDPAGLVGTTGLQMLQGMMRGELPYPHIADTLDYALIAVEAGRVTFQGTPQVRHYNPMGTAHGGWYATLLDSALWCAIQSTLPAGRSHTTVELTMNIVRAATATAGPLRAVGSVLHAGRQLATAEGKLMGQDGKLYAHATTTCLVFELPRPR